MAFASTRAPAQEVQEPTSILVRNLTLFDPAGSGEDRMVSLIIRDGNLEIVTEDAVSSEGMDEVINANAGYIMGQLELGSPPSFIVLITDPRENFDVLLDTKQHAAFAVNEGRIVKNELIDVVDEEIEESPPGPAVRTGWLAYSPPPLAVPLSYADTTKWNRFESAPVSGLFSAAVVLDRMHWMSQNDANRAQFGDLSTFDGGEIRGLRFGLVGTLNMFERPWVYTIFGATNAFDKGFNEDGLDDFTWFDWRIDIPAINGTTVSIGKQKEPISAERVQSMIFNQMQERSAAADAMMPSRNVGIVWNGGGWLPYSTWAVGVFNDWLDAGQDLDDSATQMIGRLTWAPLRTVDDSSLLHLGIGYRYSDAKEGFRYSAEPEFNQSAAFVDTNFGFDGATRPADDLQTINAELAWRRGPLWIRGEYTRAAVDSGDLGDPVFDGYSVAGSWVLTGEMREYNKKNGTFMGVPTSRSVYQGGKGAWEVSARWSSVDLSDGPVDGGTMDVASLGLTWWLTPIFSVSGNYRYVWNTLGGVDGTSSGFNARLLLILE